MTEKKKSRNAQEIALPVHRILEILHKWGVHTLGDLGRLDKEELRARLGPEAAILWERANGQSIRLLKLIQPPECFEESFEFEHEVETIEPLLFMLRRFLQQLSDRLHAVYLVAKELTLRLKFTSKQDYERCFKIPQPTNDIDLLFRMLHTHLENFKSDYPIIAVSLEALPVKSIQQQFGLFETALRDPNQLYETLARLTGLLGADRVGTPVLEETHRPDAFHLEPFLWQVEAIAPNRPGQRQGRAPASLLPQRRRGLGLLRAYGSERSSLRAGGSAPEAALHQPGSLPESERIGHAALRRFRPGVSASVLLEDNKPVHLRSAEMSGKASAQNGPYIGSGNWWDEKAWTRIEWDLHLGNGALLRCHQNTTGWQVDGIYD
jgi:protein ImuB